MLFDSRQFRINHDRSVDKNYRSSQHKLRPRKDKKHWEDKKKDRAVNRRKRKRKTITRG